MAESRTIDVKKQRNMTVVETFHLCVKGISHRLVRSVLTLAVVVLAVAFFMFLLSENSFVSTTATGVGERVLQQRLATRLLDHLYNVPSTMVLSRRLSDAGRSSQANIGEYAQITKWESDRVRKLAQTCAKEQAYLKFFDEIPVGKRMVLVGKRKWREAFVYLGDKKEQALFSANLKNMVELRVPGGIEEFLSFLNGFEAYEEELNTFVGALKQAVDGLTADTAAMTGGTAVDAWLSTADDAQLSKWGAAAGSFGFTIKPDELPVIRKQLKLATLKQEIMGTLGSVAKQEQWRKAFKERKRLSTDEKLLRLEKPEAAKILDDKYTAEQLADVVRATEYENRLSRIEQKLSGKVEADATGSNLSGRQVFLLFISFLVCMVGIANAMLMSITERFREIATMKCLGATDRYILVQFMMEAALQGICGGLLGMLIGFLIALIKNTGSFGSYVFAYWPGIELLWGGLVSLAAGVLLAVLASIYPSWAASRMAPMEAMRVE